MTYKPWPAVAGTSALVVLAPGSGVEEHAHLVHLPQGAYQPSKLPLD